MPYHQPTTEIAISAAEMQEFRQKLSALTIKEITDMLHCGKTTFYAWMEHGVPGYQRAGAHNVRAAQEYMEKHGRKAILENKIVPFVDKITYRDKQCTIVIMVGRRARRCAKNQTGGSPYCYMHKREIQQGVALMTVTGEMVGGKPNTKRAELPKQCIAVEKGGNRCGHMGAYENGICPAHAEQLQKLGYLNVVEKNIVRTIYADT